jgi:uncharacterized membrane protein YidH (DUF202 family)
MKIAGVILILLGVAALVYGGLSYSTHKRAVDLGPLQVNKTEHHTIPFPPILGIVAVAGGGILLFFGAKEGK